MKRFKDITRTDALLFVYSKRGMHRNRMPKSCNANKTRYLESKINNYSKCKVYSDLSEFVKLINKLFDESTVQKIESITDVLLDDIYVFYKLHGKNQKQMAMFQARVARLNNILHIHEHKISHDDFLKLLTQLTLILEQLERWSAALKTPKRSHDTDSIKD